MIKVIIFDLGGVIVLPEVENILKYVSQYAEIDYASFIAYYNAYKTDLTKGKISLKDVYAKVANHFNLKHLTSQDLVNEHLRIFNHVIENLDDEIIALVEKLKKSYTVVCLVNAEIDVVPLVRNRGVYDYFKHAYISTEMGMQKPDAEIYISVLEDVHCKPEETVFIDDKEANVEGANKLGIHSIWYKNHNELIEELKKMNVSELD